MAAAAVRRCDIGCGAIRPAPPPGRPMPRSTGSTTGRSRTLWAAGARGQGITIAEIDTGVNAALPELRGRIAEGHRSRSAGRRPDRPRGRRSSATAPRWRRSWSPGPGLLGITGLAPDAKVLPIAVPLDGHDRRRPARPPARGDPLRRRPRRQDHQHVARREAHADQRPGAVPGRRAGGDLPRAAQGCAGRRRRSATPARRATPSRIRASASASSRSARSTPPARSPASPAAAAVPDPDRARRRASPSLSRVEGRAYSGDGTSQATAITPRPAWPSCGRATRG